MKFTHVQLFVFSKDFKRVILQRMETGYYAGVFGALRDGENILDGANRIFRENTDSGFRNWQLAASHSITGDDMGVAIFMGVSEFFDDAVTTKRAELLKLNIAEAILLKHVNFTIAWQLLMCVDLLDSGNALDFTTVSLPSGLLLAKVIPDDAPRLKIAIVCNERTDFSELAQLLKSMNDNVGNTFICVTGTRDAYGLDAHSYYIHTPFGELHFEATKALNMLKHKGVKADALINDKYIKPVTHLTYLKHE